jgi:molybdopterin-containing oxidoreductase family iron-sulfur binding subunit
MKWSGKNTAYGDFVRSYWLTKLGSQEAMDKALQDGILETPVTAAGAAFNAAAVSPAATALAAAKKGGKAELILYPKISIGNGKDANNPWLQELPDPITKAAWDNYAVISYALAKELGINLDDSYEVEVTRPVITIKSGNKELRLPIMAVPGMHPNVIAVAVGYGRNEKAGRAGANVGVNAYPFVGFNGNTFDYVVTDVTYEKQVM